MRPVCTKSLTEPFSVLTRLYQSLLPALCLQVARKLPTSVL